MRILFSRRDTLLRRKFASRSEDGISPTSHALSLSADSSSLLEESYSDIPSSSRGQGVRGWPAHPAEFLSDRGTMREFQLSCLTERWRTAAPNVCAQSLIFCTLCGAIGTGGNGLITDMADRIIVRSSTAYWDYSRPPNGLSSVILPWLRFQSLSRSSATQQVKRVISVWFWDLLEVFKAVFRHLNRYNSLRWHVTVNQGRWKKKCIS